MIGDLGAPELLIIFALVVLLFGAGKVGRLGKDLGTSVKEFRRAMRDDEDAPSASLEPAVAPGYSATVEAPATPVATSAPAAAAAPSPTRPASSTENRAIF